MSIEEFDAIVNRQRERYDKIISDVDNNIERVNRLKQFAINTPAYLEQLNKEFENKSSLNHKETLILSVAVGMQLLRQHFLTKFPSRFDDQTAAKNTIGHIDEHSNRHHRYYNPSLDEIITNPVPFDANIGANGALGGGGMMGHRVTAIGHDPMLGLIIGTVNIATSTITTKDLVSYHVKTFNNRDAFAENASTVLVLSKTAEKLNEGQEGLKKVGVSFIKELIHLKSDLNTHHSLPLPLISVIDAKFASELASYGLDFSNVVTVVKQATLARMINCLIAMYHFSFFDNSIPLSIYKVKTKKSYYTLT